MILIPTLPPPRFVRLARQPPPTAQRQRPRDSVDTHPNRPSARPSALLVTIDVLKGMPYGLWSGLTPIHQNSTSRPPRHPPVPPIKTPKITPAYSTSVSRHQPQPSPLITKLSIGGTGALAHTGSVVLCSGGPARRSARDRDSDGVPYLPSDLLAVWRPQGVSSIGLSAHCTTDGRAASVRANTRGHAERPCSFILHLFTAPHIQRCVCRLVPCNTSVRRVTR